MEYKGNHSASYIIATCCFIGHVPLSPGTVTSAIAAITLFFLPPFSAFTFFIVLNALFFIGTITAEQTSIVLKQHDAPLIVIDEWFGMWLALFLVPKNIWLYLTAFILFRIFDIVKPPPISTLEKKVPGGLGIMLDDACAALFSLIIVHVATFFL